MHPAQPFHLSWAERREQGRVLPCKAKKNSCPAFHRRIAFATVAVCSRVWFFHCHSLQPALAGKSHLALDFTQWTLFQELHPNSSLFLYGALLTTFPIDDKNDEQTGIVFAEPFIYQLGRPPAPSFKCSVPWHRPMAEQKKETRQACPISFGYICSNESVKLKSNVFADRDFFLWSCKSNMTEN